MKNLILASFLTLIFTQDLITTRAFQVPISYFSENYSYTENDENSNATAYIGNFDLNSFIDVNIGYTTYGFLKNCDEFQNFSLSFELDDGSCEDSSGMPGNVNFYCWDSQCSGDVNLYFHCPSSIYDFYLYYSNNDIINAECEIELWVVSNFEDSTGLIDDLQDQINDLEVQVEGLLAELLDCQGCNGDVNTDENIDILDVITVVQHILDTDTDGCIEN